VEGIDVGGDFVLLLTRCYGGVHECLGALEGGGLGEVYDVYGILLG